MAMDFSQVLTAPAQMSWPRQYLAPLRELPTLANMWRLSPYNLASAAVQALASPLSGEALRRVVQEGPRP